MQISLKTKNRKLTSSEEELVRKKVARLPRFLDHLSDAEVIISTEHTHRGEDKQIVQLTIRANGTLLRAEEHDAEMQTALDAALDKVERRIARYKGRYERKRKGQPSLGEAMAPVAVEEETDEAAPPPRPVVRTKRFTVQPMQKEDAVEQMELLGHSFFVFFDADTKHMGVLYRRQDGNYGVLEPELA
ncbi:MAG TPA: ribosome-associated translation inhibitor RaiA [Chloroflexia bacterium]|nr:ribosome-associated translation inhibitor RaiA [Chloroflexia bacterium]